MKVLRQIISFTGITIIGALSLITGILVILIRLVKAAADGLLRRME